MKTLNNNNVVLKSFIFSIILHCLFLYIFISQAKLPQIKNRKVIKVNLNHLKRQIIDPKNTPETEKEIDTNLLSEKNTFADKEQIKRGESEAKQIPSLAKLAKPKETKNNNKNSNNKPLKKTPPKDVKKFQTKISEKSPSETENKKEIKSSDLNRLLQPNIGSMDMLNQIPDGEITLLNSKANKYAVFVRRVANQVFGALRKYNWSEMTFSEVRQIKQPARFEAILNNKGELIEVKNLQSSFNIQFDHTLKKSVDTGAWDQNPPEGANAADGKIHFIFESHISSSFSPQGRGERRWLYLGTGLL